jgi:hypothetical protein
MNYRAMLHGTTGKNWTKTWMKMGAERLQDGREFRMRLPAAMIASNQVKRNAFALQSHVEQVRVNRKAHGWCGRSGPYR